MTPSEELDLKMQLFAVKAKYKAIASRFLVACVVSWGLGVMMALGLSSYAGQADVLQRMSQAYEAGHLGDFQALFAPEATHQDKPIGQEIPAYGELFARPESRVLRFYDVTTRNNGTGAAWIDAAAKEICSGLAEWRIENDKIVDFRYQCFEDQLQFDGALAGQALDAVTTVYALASDNFVEANPIVDTAPGLLLPLKLAASRLAEEAEAATCRGLKSAFALVGAGAGVWNLCTFAGGAAVLCAPVGIAAGWAIMSKTEEYNAAACRRYDNIDFLLIDSTRVVTNDG